MYHDAKTPPQNSELFSLTYGALVVQLIKDFEDYEQVNIQLEKMYVHTASLKQGDTILGLELSKIFWHVLICRAVQTSARWPRL